MINSIIELFRSSKKGSAQIAKERLQLVVAHQRTADSNPDYLPKMKQELIEVIKKYVNVENEDIQVLLENSPDCSVLELNVTLPK